MVAVDAAEETIAEDAVEEDVVPVALETRQPNTKDFAQRLETMCLIMDRKDRPIP